MLVAIFFNRASVPDLSSYSIRYSRQERLVLESSINTSFFSYHFIVPMPLRRPNRLILSHLKTGSHCVHLHLRTFRILLPSLKHLLLLRLFSVPSEYHREPFAPFFPTRQNRIGFCYQALMDSYALLLLFPTSTTTILWFL